MPATFEDALTYARAIGAGFTVEAVREKFGGSARDNAELVRRVKAALAAEEAGERHERLKAAQIPDTLRPIIESLVAAVGDATLHLQDALLGEHDRMSRAVAEAVAAADRRAEQTLVSEREQLALSRAAAEAEATQREAMLKADLATASNALTEAQTEVRGLQAECDRLRRQLAETTATTTDLRQRAERAEAELTAAREIIGHSHDIAEAAKREREGVAGELRATQASLRSAEAQIAQLLDLLAQPRGGAGKIVADPHHVAVHRDGGSGGSTPHGMGARGNVAAPGHPDTSRPKHGPNQSAQERR